MKHLIAIHGGIVAAVLCAGCASTPSPESLDEILGGAAARPDAAGVASESGVVTESPTDLDAAAPIELVAFQPAEPGPDLGGPALRNPMAEAGPGELIPAPNPQPNFLTPGLINSDTPDPFGQPVETVTLGTVLSSVFTTFPDVEGARLEQEIALGKQLESWGPFDFNLRAYHIAQPLSFYQNFQTFVGFERTAPWGGKFSGHYRRGEGNFEPWYGERETDQGGEFKLGFAVPLLQGLPIDEKRAKLFKSELDVAGVTPLVQAALLQASLDATLAYWDWVAAGRSYAVAMQLLDNANRRNTAIEKQVAAGDLPRAELIDNERLIADRQLKLLETERKLQKAAIKLSIYYRSPDGRPRVPTADQLPREFPPIDPPSAQVLLAGQEVALEVRPELRQLEIFRQQATVDLSLAQNQTLPELDASIEAKKDVGELTSSKGDKRPFELIASLMFDVPLQRRQARGAIRSAQGKIAQIGRKRELTANKIVADVADATSALLTAAERVEQARKTVELNLRLEQLELQKFGFGDSTLLIVNLREKATADARLVEIETRADFLKAIAAYRAAVGVDPLVSVLAPGVGDDAE